ncbi:hypothetical protein [Anatilimnocola floriformis]|uniref:hypothetical protein n=1 Tax=Anatilimnocola floriformis TaxID=2948575 RepID=UPI0020C325FA|nr:hypothetical protein [Anatilimnocola floriformis]
MPRLIDCFRIAALAVVIGIFWAGPCAAQQNLFNVPSARITPPEDVFFQQQFNFLQDGASNTTIEFGLWEGFEAGFNILDVPLYLGGGIADLDSNNTADFLVNLQKGIPLSELVHLGIGTQLGVTQLGTALDAQRPTALVNFDWIVVESEIPDVGFFYGGAYYGNKPYLGKGNTLGLMLGTEVPIVEDKFSFMADVLMGSNDISVAVIGGVYTFPGTRWQLSLGAQLPFPGSHNDFGAVLEITRVAGNPKRELGPLGTLP